MQLLKETIHLNNLVAYFCRANKINSWRNFMILLQLKKLFRSYTNLLLAILVVTALAANGKINVAQADEPKPAAKPPVPVKKKLTGAELYAINCNRCHPERYPTEFTSGQWETLITHMRVRANLPAKQAREILKYLEAGAGN
jgi:hypothetical protein